MIKQAHYPRSHIGMSHRSGTAYIAILAVSLMITTIGMTSLATLRLQRNTTSKQQQTLEADKLASAAMHLAIYKIQNDPYWQDNHTNNVWVSATFGGGTISYKLVDEDDGDLSNNVLDEVKLVGKGVVGSAVRMVRVELESDGNMPNLLTNPDIENSLSGWIAYGGASMLNTTSQAYQGSASVLVYGRPNPSDGVGQNLTSVLRNAKTYQLSLWAKTAAGNMQVQIDLSTTGSASTAMLQTGTPVSIDASQWTLITQTFVVNWMGTLTNAYFQIGSVSNNGDLYIDAASLQAIDGSPTKIVPVSGTWEKQMN